MRRSARSFVPDPLMAAADYIELWVHQARASEPKEAERTLKALHAHVERRQASRAAISASWAAQLIRRRCEQAGITQHDPATLDEVEAFLEALPTLTKAGKS